MTGKIPRLKIQSILKIISDTFICASICFVFVSIDAAFAAPKDDLGVMFRSDRSLPPPGGISGTVTNKSTNHYECVDLVFFLIYKNGASGPAELRVRVQNLSPASVTNYSSALRSRAGFGLKRIEPCKTLPEEEQPMPPPPASDPKRDCTIRGVVNSIANFEGIGDTGRLERIEKVYLLTPDGKKVSEDWLSEKTTRVNDHRAGKTKQYLQRKYSFSRIPANQNYVIQLSYAWRTSPAQVRVSCPNSKGHFDFGIPPLKHTGNRLGG